jgi:3-deoxy-D-manno-octulosonic-acid transferase
MYVLYNLALVLGFFFISPYYALKISLGKYRKSIGPKLGMVPAETFIAMQGTPRIWLHAVSVGEATAAAPIVKALRQHLPGACIVVSTSTETGQEMARKIVSGVTSFIYYPLDFPWVVRKMIDRVRPDVFAAVETEIWPNFMRACKERKIRVLLVNGRISPRSFRRYYKTRFFWEKILGLADEIGAISDVDSRRLQSIGVPEKKVHVFGNAKYDSLAARVDRSLQEEVSRALAIPPETHVFVAGSTHEGEEEIVLNVYRELLRTHPDFLLIMVPRHIERGAKVVRIASAAGFPDSIRMTEIRAGRARTTERVIVIDVIGELFKAYSLASVVFCGGSLVPKGGQNILEAAAWGKVVFYGPHMDDFSSESDLLERSDSGMPVREGRELLEGILRLMADPDMLRKKGEAGRMAIASNQGASQRYAKLIMDALRFSL